MYFAFIYYIMYMYKYTPSHTYIHTYIRIYIYIYIYIVLAYPQSLQALKNCVGLQGLQVVPPPNARVHTAFAMSGGGGTPTRRNK